MLANSITFYVIKAYSSILRHYVLRHIQAYLDIFSTLHIYSPFQILSPGIFRTGGFFKTLWNIHQVYSEPCHKELISHIQAIQNFVRCLHMQKPDILAIVKHSEHFHNCIPTHMQNPVIFKKIFQYSELQHI